MDHEVFDRLARVLGAAGSRRAALGALLGAGVLGAAETALGKKKQRKGAGKGKGKGKESNAKQDTNRGKRGRDAGRGEKRQPPAVDAPSIEEPVTAEAADCFSLGPSSNVNRCNYSGEDHAGEDLSSSSMVGTKFNNANLCGADLSSSQLKNAQFNGANLTRADLSSSGCRGTQFNNRTVFCRTKTCNGAVSNRDCPTGADACCGMDECETRVCRTTECRESACFYGEQVNNQPGTLCRAPQVCCNGNCCDAGQKCCGSTCIDEDACCTDGEERCPPGAACVDGECEVTCIALDQACMSAVECCGPGPRDCRDRFFDPTTRCCIAHGGACTGPGNNNDCCRESDDSSEAGAVCRGGICCTTSGDRCQNSGQCCQNPATQVCQPVSTCGGGISAVCCQPAGAPCGDRCDCCDGYCVDGRCSAACLANGELCDSSDECCSVICGATTQPARCEAR